MASRSLTPFQLTTTLFLALLATCHAGSIAVYWGQNDGEASLAETCTSGNYEFVILAFLPKFGKGQTPQLDLANHCDPSSGGCRGQSKDIKSCQGRGVKVLLSIGGGDGSYGLSSPGDARQVALYLWNNYLGGASSSVPLGDVVLDGINFDIEQGSAKFWNDLATDLKNLGKNGGKTVLLSTAPQCPFPGEWDGGAISTGCNSTTTKNASSVREGGHSWTRGRSGSQCRLGRSSWGFRPPRTRRARGSSLPASSLRVCCRSSRTLQSTVVSCCGPSSMMTTQATAPPSRA
ncbi:hypothetical protein CFC21_048855, partial [Triticum aestivum]